MSDQSNAELLPRLTRYLDYFQALTEVGKALTGNLKLEQVLQTVMRCLTQLLKPQSWSLMLLDEAKNELYFEIVVGPAADAIRNMRLPVGEGIAGWVAKNREAVVAPRVADDPRFSKRMDKASAFHTASILCVPLICRGRLLGVMELVKDEGDPEPYQSEHLQILGPLADFAAIAIDNARVFAAVENLTILDEWTGLYNARYLRAYIADEVLRAERYRHELAVAFLDLDNFKTINDTHGHGAGSATLREVGLLLKDTARETDRVARYGGDEFVVVMPETAKEGALNLAERMRFAIETTSFAVDATLRTNVTASFGIACFPSDAGDAKSLLEAADRAMYFAKAKGRNAVIDAATMPK